MPATAPYGTTWPVSTFNAQIDGTYSGSGTGTVFNNAGTVVKSAGTGTTYFSVPFNNTGTVTVQSGTIDLYGGGTSSGAFTEASGASFEFKLRDLHTLMAGASSTGVGMMLVNGGTVTVATAVSVQNLTPLQPVL